MNPSQAGNNNREKSNPNAKWIDGCFNNCKHRISMFFFQKAWTGEPCPPKSSDDTPSKLRKMFNIGNIEHVKNPYFDTFS
jgi:hypothetical protein